MGYRRERKKKSSKSPSVGSYNLRKKSDLIVPASRFGKEKRDNLNINKSALDNPGPGEYSYYSEKTSSSSPKWSIGPSEMNLHNNNKIKKIKEENNNQIPGPGYYKINSYIGKEGKKYSFGKDKFNHSDAFDEYIKRKVLDFPSPTTYNKSYYKYIPNSPQWSISQLNRKNIINDKFKMNSPGPEKYHPDYKINSIYKKYPIWSFNQSNRDEDENSNNGSKKIRFNTPPPGYYTVRNGMIPQGFKYSIYGLRKRVKIDDSPGPGEYTIKYDGKLCEPKFSFNKENKSNYIKIIEKDNYPGPGSYNIKDNYTSKKVSFAPINVKKKFRKIKKYLVPGPGHYKIPSSFDYISNMTREKGTFDPTFKYI